MSKKTSQACKRFKSGNESRFNETCAYNHSKINDDEEKNNLMKKVENLEKTICDLNKKGESEIRD